MSFDFLQLTATVSHGEADMAEKKLQTWIYCLFDIFMSIKIKTCSVTQKREWGVLMTLITEND